MSNDTSTLAGALLEMKDQLIYELGQKGVTASYDSSTGLLGLIGRISDIQTGGSCYHIEFSEASYVAVGGSATLEVVLQSNYAPLSGATVTVTGSDSSLYTGITNSSGVAEVTVTGVSGTVTFTCTYSNVSDTCSVTAASYLFFDDCSSASGISQYGNSVIITGGTSTLTFNTDHYIMSGSGGDFNGFVIPNSLGKDNVKIRVKAKLSQTNAYNQFGLMVCNNTTYNVNQGLRIRGDKKFQRFDFNPSESESTIYTHSTEVTDWFYYELVKQGAVLTINMYDTNLNLLGSNTGACTAFSEPNYVFYHLSNRGASYTTHIQEILVESV